MTTKHTDLLRSIPVPPAGSEESFAFFAMEQILNFAFNRYLGNLDAQGFLSKSGKSAATSWVDGRPGPLLQLKFDTMDQMQERFTPNLIQMARAFYGAPRNKPEGPDLSQTAKVNPAVGKHHLYQLLKDFALAQSTKHVQSQQAKGWWDHVQAATQGRNQRAYGDRMLRLLRLAMAAPTAGESGVNADDATFLNGPASRFLEQERSDACFPYAVALLNGLAFLAQDHPYFVAAGWDCEAYNPEISLRKCFDNLYPPD